MESQQGFFRGSPDLDLFLLVIFGFDPIATHYEESLVWGRCLVLFLQST